MTSRYKKVGYTAAAGLGLFLGAAGIAAAANGDTSTPPAPASQTVEVDGVNCENGLDTATGAECDGGPAAAQADESTEAPDNETDATEEDDGSGDEAVDGVDHQFEGEEVGENGNGIPDADDANETDQAEAPAVAGLIAVGQPTGDTAEADGSDDEAVDGVDHQFEGEEVGENGNGIADADDANETETDG